MLVGGSPDEQVGDAAGPGASHFHAAGGRKQELVGMHLGEFGVLSGLILIESFGSTLKAFKFLSVYFSYLCCDSHLHHKTSLDL